VGVKAARAAALQYEAVHAGVCGRARGSVWRCTRQCARQCQAMRQCGSVRLCGRARLCGSVVVCSSAAVCGSARGSVRQCVAVCASVRGIVWWQCALRKHIHQVAHNIYFILLYPL
jgi:hypothetical protein